MTSQVKLGLVDVWEKHGEGLDFLIKADDDTFVIMDNLMARLQRRDPEVPFMMGHKMTNEVDLNIFSVNIEELDIYFPQGFTFLSGGPGYVMSRAAVRRLVMEGLSPGGSHLCRDKVKRLNGGEDLEMGSCALRLGIALTSSEMEGRTTFLPFK